MIDPTGKGLFAILSAGLGLPYDPERLIQSPEEWGRIAEFAQAANVEPQAFAGAKRLPPKSSLPVEMVARWRNAFASSAVHHDRLIAMTRPVLGNLARAGIPVALLKGAYLASVAYPNPAARPMNDVDLLIRASDLPAVHLALTSTEWLLASDLATNMALDNQASYKHAATGLSLDLHWSVLGRYTPFRMPDVAIWTSVRPALIGMPGVMALSPEHAILDLCVHPREDGRVTTVQALCDIAGLVTNQTVDWVRLGTDADAWGMRNYAWLILTMCKSLLNAPIPDTALESLRASGTYPISREAFLRAWSSLGTPLGEHDTPDTEETHVVDLLAQGATTGRLAAAMGAAFPPIMVVAKQFQLGKAPWWRAIWFYPLRWWGLVSRYSGKIAGAWRTGATAEGGLREQAAGVELFRWLDAGAAANRPPSRRERSDTAPD
jgi:hypothetical protein